MVGGIVYSSFYRPVNEPLFPPNLPLLGQPAQTVGSGAGKA